MLQDCLIHLNVPVIQGDQESLILVVKLGMFHLLDEPSQTDFGLPSHDIAVVEGWVQEVNQRIIEAGWTWEGAAKKVGEAVL